MGLSGIRMRARMRKQSIPTGVLTAVGVLLITTTIAVTSAPARIRFPVMGCFNFQTGESSLEYAPYGRCSFYRGSIPGGPVDVGIYHTHWTHWGRKQVIGRGDFYDSLGYLHPATMMLYGLLSSHDTRICSLGGSAYSNIRVTWKAVEGGGVRRSAGTHVFNVTPIDVGC